jgi:hypothetical protein
LLDKRCESDPLARAALEQFDLQREHEPLFIKNLENLQGDERDVIFISFTYGKDPASGKVFKTFWANESRCRLAAVQCFDHACPSAAGGLFIDDTSRRWGRPHFQSGCKRDAGLFRVLPDASGSRSAN